MVRRQTLSIIFAPHGLICPPPYPIVDEKEKTKEKGLKLTKKVTKLKKKGTKLKKKMLQHSRKKLQNSRKMNKTQEKRYKTHKAPDSVAPLWPPLLTH